MKFLLFFTLSLFMVASINSAPIAEDAEPAPAPAPASDSSEDAAPIGLLPKEVRQDDSDTPDAPSPAQEQELIAIPKEDVEIVAISSTSTIVTPVEAKKSDLDGSTFVDLDNIHLSPKLARLYSRLSDLDQDVLRSGILKFREILLQSKSRDEFLETLWREKTTNANADPRELLQFKSDLNELASFIAEQHPKVLSWFLATVGGGRPTTTNSKLSFLEKFSEIDEEMSTHAVWNRYWDYWFQSTGDFIAKWG